ncbi:MAG: hypothetical protein FWE42_09465, partial [Defluviitaleaceae bacterium]|nr:hypothetical protein [Defluviitaleaceae bacterium]
MRYCKRLTSILSTGPLARLLRDVNTRIKRIFALTLVLALTTTLFFVHGDNTTHNNNDVGDTSPIEYIAHGCCHTAESRGVETLGHHGHGSKDIVYYVLHIYRGQTIADILPLVPMQSGHSFNHWSRQPNGAPFDFNRPIMTEMRFYAIWEAEANDYYNPQGGYISYAPEYLYNQAPEYTYNYYEYYQAQEYNYSGHNHSYAGHNYCYDQRQEDGHDNAYDNGYSYEHDNAYNYDNAYSYDCGHIFYSPLCGYISYAPYDLFYEVGHYQAYDLGWYSYAGFDYPYGYASYGFIYYNSPPSSGYYYGYAYAHEYDYYHRYDYAYGNYLSHDYSCNSYDNNYDSHYAHGYEYEYGYEYAHEQEPLYYEYEDNYYRDTPAYGDIITITFLYNHGGYWPEYNLLNLTGKLNIYVDDSANVTVYPQVMHSTVLYGEYFRVKFPMVIYFDDINVNMANSNWTYEISHMERENVTLMAGSDGEVKREYELRTYTVVTISHDILETHTQPTEVIYLQVDQPGGGNYGFVPFASNEPFTMAILAPPFDSLVSWTTALGPTNENRVVVIPQDVDLPHPWGITINTPRHVIFTSYGTNLNFSTTNHTAPPTVFTMYFASTGFGQRHFTVANGGTLTLSHITLDGNEGTMANDRGGVNLNNGGNLHMLSGSTIQHNRGGAVVVNGTTGAFTMSGDSRIYRNTAAPWHAAGGVSFFGARTLSMYDNASILHNHNMSSAAGVALGASGSHLIMNDNSSISHNISNTSGAGVSIQNGAQLTMNGGSINNNSVSGAFDGAPIGRGGGVHIHGPSSFFTFNGGSIHSNHASANGGGIYASESVYSNVLPLGAFPQLNIAPEASFSNNTAGIGGFTPPVNALAATNIQTTQSSGGFSHPLNNLDINFANIDADWFRLNSAIHGTSATNIVIHPAGTTGVADGITGSTYNLIISDPSDDGNVITTLDISGTGFTDHFIEITRTVTIQAADGADIILRMPVPGAPNTPDIAPWVTNHEAIGRHFVVVAGGDLTLNGIGTGTLTLDGNADLITASRGGIMVGS